MEAVNFTPKQLRKTMWSVAAIIGILILLWRLPDILAILLVAK